VRRRGHEDVASKDVYLNGFAIVAAVLAIIIHLINPPTQESTVPPPGNLVVTIVWPDGDTDVDIWIDGPKEPRFISYQNRTGIIWSLLRDDRGNIDDPMPLNMENAYSRTIYPGRYTFNLHCFRCSSGLPIPVFVEIETSGNVPKTLLQTEVTIVSNRQEITVVSFELTEDGAIVPGSEHNVFKKMFPTDYSGGGQ